MKSINLKKKRKEKRILSHVYEQLNEDYFKPILEKPVFQYYRDKSEREKTIWDVHPLKAYFYLNNFDRGYMGEDIVSEILTMKYGYIVNPRSSPGHDRTVWRSYNVQGYKTEIKSSIMIRVAWIFNHLAKKKDWDRLILFGLTLDWKLYICFLTKEDFLTNIEYFRKQQGGEEADNDDYWLRGDEGIEIFAQPFVRNVKDW